VVKTELSIKELMNSVLSGNVKSACPFGHNPLGVIAKNYKDSRIHIF